MLSWILEGITGLSLVYASPFPYLQNNVFSHVWKIYSVKLNIKSVSLTTLGKDAKSWGANVEWKHRLAYIGLIMKQITKLW